jgi:adenylyltransferase/sulfurtransferase
MPVDDRYDRQVLFAPLGAAGQERLRRSTALIVGCGALGTHAADLLARAGVGTLRLVDRDIVERSNLHRQGSFDEEDARLGLPKAEALAAHLARACSGTRIDAHARDFHHGNALDLARGADVILDGTDNLPARFLLNEASWSLGVPWIYAGAVGSAAHVQLFSGTAGPCLRCQLPELPAPGSIATCDTAGIIGPAAAIAASWQAALAIRFLAGGDAGALAGKKAMLSPWDLEARVVRVEADPACPVCAAGRFEALAGAFAGGASVLCGRDAVQVVPPPGARGLLDLDEAARRLAPFGRAARRGPCVRLEAREGFTLTLFEDGRAIFGGLTDAERARSLYARLVGH